MITNEKIGMETWKNNLRKIQPYVPGEQPDKANMIKLNTNENPYPPSPRVAKAMRVFSLDKLRLYPNASAQPIVKELANFYERNESEIFVGVGSDDVLATVFMALFNSGKPVFFPDITYSFYDVWAQLFHVPYEQIPLDENFRIRKEDYYRTNGGVLLANPNAPTSICECTETIEDIIRHNQNTIVIIDEAYIDFGGTSALPLIDKYDNLLIVQTFSKARSMAGMRVGYAIGNPVLIKALNDVKHSFNSYTINQPSLYYAVEALKDKAYFEEQLKKIIDTREWSKQELKKLGFHFPDSKANFLFITHEKCPAKELFDTLREKEIFVRYFNKPRISNYLRVTIGTREQMSIFIDFLKDYLVNYNR
jgi:histidinol-phosphate aminotransferase